MKPVIVNQIKVTSKTSEVTGLVSFEAIQTKSATLFGTMNDTQLGVLYNKIHSNKLSDADISAFSSLPKAEKRNKCVKSLTFQLELTQEVNSTQEGVNNVLSMFLTGRANTTGNSKKYFWQTTTLDFCNTHSITQGFNLSEYYGGQNYVTYLVRTNFTEIPEKELVNGLITYAPKTQGKGGDILTFNDKLIFQKTELVMKEVTNVEEAYNLLEKHESSKVINHNGVIPFDEVPTAIKQGATFNEEFQEWLQENYASRNLNMNVNIHA